MNNEIEMLLSTTFAGKRFTRKQIDGIQKIVNRFPALSRHELALTICENLNWKTASGKPKIQTCQNALEEMEAIGLFKLPIKNMNMGNRFQKKIILTSKSETQPEVHCSLEQLGLIDVRPATTKEDIALWNEFVERYHYLGYRRPIGTHLRYFISLKEGTEKILGCLSFSFPVWSLACRDEWIGWSDDKREKNINLILNNNRFLILPWVHVKNLASKALSLIARRIAEDWLKHHGFKPVLLETFVDPEAGFEGTCYKAANWIFIGKTNEKNSKAERSQKETYVYPLDPDFKAILNHEKKQVKTKKNNSRHANDTKIRIDSNDPFVSLWVNIIDIVVNVANAFDRQWQQRRRTLDTMLLILFIFRLVFSKNKQGYGTTILELWEQCRLMNIKLLQSKPVAASAFCAARTKLDENIFKMLNANIIAAYEKQRTEYLWEGHRLFAVDGTKINLPRALAKKSYAVPASGHYPQGLVSCLYQLKSQIPYDFNLVSDNNERTAALSHLEVLRQHDIVVYDRGYFSYAMLYSHFKTGINAVFRLQKNTCNVIDAFMESQFSDLIVEIVLPAKHRRELLETRPGAEFSPLKLRLIRYTIDGVNYFLGTTLLDKTRYREAVFPELYHARWGIEELYKISKQLIDVEDFHAQSERGIKQELFAHFVLITLNRLFTNHTEIDLNQKDEHCSHDNQTTSAKYKVNIKNALFVIGRNIESLLMQQKILITKTINRIFDAILFCKQKERPNRSYERKSMKPIKKWRPTKKKGVPILMPQMT